MYFVSNLKTRRMLIPYYKLKKFRDKSFNNIIFLRTCHAKNQKSRFNPINIQMLSSSLHNQIFSGKQEVKTDSETLQKAINHLRKHGLWGAETSTLPEVDLEIPKLHNSDILQHFHHIALDLVGDYKQLLNDILKSDLPPIPQNWLFEAGWMQYDQFGNAQKVDFPEDKALVFDVEVCMQEGNYPTLATAASDKHWYLWCSNKLIEEIYTFSSSVSLSDLIPMESKKEQNKPLSQKNCIPKIIVGHNVAFDRTFIKEQYYLERSETMFLDTMSLHMCVSGLTGMQRAMSLASKKKKTENISYSFPDLALGWSDISSLNNLADVYKLYCDKTLSKSKREIFVSGSLNDVRENFQELASYCAQDTFATFQILKKIYPLFQERFPHPVTLFGLLEMASAYLPVNHNWGKYLQETQSTYDDMQKELKLSLVHLANESCSLFHNNLYKEDPWLWDLDWSVQNIKFKKEAKKSKKKKQTANSLPKPLTESVNVIYEVQEEEKENEDLVVETDSMPDDIDESMKHILKTASSLRKVRPFMPGYPAWYRELCEKYDDGKPDWESGPYLISTQMRCVPKLMRMTWDGFPLHFDTKHGWGYLVPSASETCLAETQDFPLKKLLQLLESRELHELKDTNVDQLWALIQEPKESKEEQSKFWNAILQKQESVSKKKIHYGGESHDVGINGCTFYRLPHKDGPKNKVGNPLSKDFLSKVEDSTLQTWGKGQADRALLLSKMLSYWKNAHSRIKSQMVVWLNKDELPENIKSSKSFEESDSYGAILPRLIPAGTVTRRAVEPTWLTASNAYEDRVGSELKSMVHAPPGYHFVGADVDSQELWLAAIFGDSQFIKLHGCTAFGWMTLQGKKSAGTDMHSKTANSVGISRDQAKVLNYARIYGAGKSFAQRLLVQFNHRFTPEEAKNKVKKIYAETKGMQKFVAGADEVEENKFVFIPGSQRRIWVGGSESHMFNKLEEIALSKKPQTPALECRISRALEPRAVDKNFMTSRINWVVQSSAVDFLHLMLVCMRWLFKEFEIDGRYSICIHDEVRYLVKSQDRYRAALALQITNLLTRCFFAAKLDMNDLPQSVAFFSSVDVDTVLRKEVDMDSKTPSNPHGLEKGYGVLPGETLDIFRVLQKTNGSLLPDKKKTY